jgi:hypothetical protein
MFFLLVLVRFWGLHPTSVAAEQVKMVSAPVSLYLLHNRLGWVNMLSDLFLLCTAPVHI